MVMNNIKQMPNEEDALPILSVVIITKNEEHNIKDCIESVEWADEIILIDDLSTDRTVEIAKKYNVKIWKKKLENFGEQKNFGISKTKNDWVLSIDADERVSNDLRREIISTLKVPSCDGYYINVRCHIGKKHLRCGDSLQLRLFNKKKGIFDRSMVHERVIINGNISYLENSMIHYNYRDWGHYVQKMDKYIEIQAKKLIKSRTEFKFFYPIRDLKNFMKDFFRYKKSNTFLHSYLISRHYLSKYELIWLIPLQPILRFFLFFFVLRGFLDGRDGFKWAMLKGYASLMTYLKYYELKRDQKER